MLTDEPYSGRSLLDSKESTREESALSELVELAFTQIIRLAMTEGVGATLPLASISLAGSPFSSWAPIPCDVTVHAWPWPEVHISVVCRCMSFS